MPPRYLHQQNELPVILLMVLEYGEFSELLRVANILKQHGKFEVLIQFIKLRYEKLPEDTKLALQHGHKWVDAYGKIHTIPAKTAFGFIKNPSRKRSAPRLNTNEKEYFDKESIPSKQLCLSISFKYLAVDILNTINDLKRYYLRYRKLKRIITALKPALLIVAQDSLGKEISFALKAAKKQRIPTMIMPFAMFNTEELLKFAYGKPAFDVNATPLNRLVSLIYPQWKARFKEKYILREAGSRILALELLRLGSKTPWIPCSEPVNKITCDSKITKDNFISMGIPEERLSSIGSVVYDKLASISTEQIHTWKENIGLIEDQPTLVCGWPVNMSHWLGVSEGVFSTYEENTEFWAQLLATIRDKYHYNVVISVHPKSLESETFAAKKYKLKCVSGQSDIAIAACDLLTTLNGSSITAWAIALSKPVILFDCFLTDYPEFKNIPGCEIYNEALSFKKRLIEVCGDSEERKRLAFAMSSIAKDWGILDGKSSERLLNTIETLIS